MKSCDYWGYVDFLARILPCGRLREPVGIQGLDRMAGIENMRGVNSPSVEMFICFHVHRIFNPCWSNPALVFKSIA